MSRQAEEFLLAAAHKSADLTHRATIKRNIDSYDAAVARGKARFAGWEAARSYAAQVKSEAIRNLGPLLEEFERKVQARGGHVYWAENGEDARQYICEVA